MTDFPTQLKVVQGLDKDLQDALEDEKESYIALQEAKATYEQARARASKARADLHYATKTLNEL